MASNLQVGETVYVPKAKVGMDAGSVSAFHKVTVAEVRERSVRVPVPNGADRWIGTSQVHRSLGVLVLRVGDLQTETGLLDPLAKSMLQFLRLLLPDDQVRMHEVRSVAELSLVWAAQHGAYSHVALVGHGRRDGIRFGVDGWITAEQLGAVLSEPSNIQPKTILSLCCQTGYADYAGVLSDAAVAAAVIAPFHDVHGAVASQFCQSYLTSHLLHGETVAVAFRHARSAIPGGAVFRLWEQGELVAGAA